MTEDKRPHAEGVRRLYTALETTPYIDAETDAKLDLFVCDLLSDADKSVFAERIRKDPVLATEVRRRKADVDAHLNPDQLNEVTGNVLDATFVFRPRLKYPSWLAIAAALMVLIGVAGLIVNPSKPKRESQSLAISNFPSDATIATTELPMPAMQESSIASSPPFDALIAMNKLPTPAVHESPTVSSGPFDAAVVLGKLPTSAVQMSAALANAPFDPTIAAAKVPTPAVQLSPARNNKPSDTAIAIAKPPKPAVRESPAQSNKANWANVTALLFSAAILSSEFNDAPPVESDAAAIKMATSRGVIGEMYRSEIAGAHTQDAAKTYAVIGLAENDALNVRSRPSEKSSIVTQLRNGTAGIQVTGRTVMNGSDDWVRVTASGVKGWVRPKYLSSTRHVETADENRRRLAGRLGIALALKFGTLPAAGDDSSANFMKALGSWSADGLIESTVNEAFPDQPLVRQQVLVATKALFAGDLRLIAAGEENRRQEMIAWLQGRSPSAAQNAEIIDFLYEVYQRGHSS